MAVQDQLDNKSNIANYATLWTLPFIFSIVVAALYGVDLHNSTQAHAPANSRWVYAEVVAGFSILTCTIRCLTNGNRAAWLGWDFVLIILWTTLFGVFGKRYIGSNLTSEFVDMTTSVSRMKSAVWVDLINTFLWLATAIHDCATGYATFRAKRSTPTPVDEENAVFSKGNLKDSSMIVVSEKVHSSVSDFKSKEEKGALMESRSSEVDLPPLPPYSA